MVSLLLHNGIAYLAVLSPMRQSTNSTSVCYTADHTDRQTDGVTQHHYQKPV